MTNKVQIIKKEELCQLIPHAGSMCLIDKVTSWDETHIICYTKTHQDNNNPLRNDKLLPMSALIEYGAQAMAIHGGLLAKASGDVMHKGYLAALRDVNMCDGDVSQIESVLCIEAEQKMASQGNMIYSFMIKVDETILVSGRATVVAIFDNN